MATRTENSRSNGGETVNQTNITKDPQVPLDPSTDKVNNADFRTSFQVLSHAMKDQANREVAVPLNPNVGSVATRVRDFTRMTP